MGMGIIQLNDEGKFVQANKVSVNKKTSKSDELIKTISWNEQTEVFPLKSNKKLPNSIMGVYLGTRLFCVYGHIVENRQGFKI
jgi:hypothetical protein